MTNVVQYISRGYFVLQCNEGLANSSEKFLLLHTHLCKPINPNGWVDIQLRSFLNEGHNCINTFLDFVQALLEVARPVSDLFCHIFLPEV